MEHWYLIQFKPNSHKIAERNLNLQKFRTFLPMQVITTKKSSKFVTCLKPLFPGYMFLTVNDISNCLRKINSTVGVSRLVSVKSKPSLIPTEVVLELMERCDEDGKLNKQKRLNIGEPVKLISGPFSNFVATVDNIDENQRIWVLMNLMGRNTRIKMDTEQLNLA